MRTTKPYTVFQPILGQSIPRFLFVIHARSLEQARALVAAKVAGEVIVVAVTLNSGVSPPFNGAAR